MKKRLSNSEEETHSIAKSYAEDVNRGEVVCLYGNLGAGKTHFVQGFVQAFGLSGDVVSSPTFTIIHEYVGTLPVYHFDCYRLEDYREALEIGAEEYFYGDGVCIVEWPDKIAAILPPGSRRVTINTTGKHKREIIFQ